MVKPKSTKASLPPLNSLRAFAMAARHGGIRRAAAALQVDHTVVSRHIRALEAWAGLQLINRASNPLTLTKEGTFLYATMGPAMAQIEQAAQELRTKKKRHRVVVWCVPGLASQWLTPRLDDFRAAHPDVDLEFRPTDHGPDFQRFQADVDVRFHESIVVSSRPPKAIRQIELARPPVIAVASPDYAASIMATGTPNWTEATLLHEEDEHSWSAWLSAHEIALAASHAGPRLWHANLTLEGAKRGQGVALTNIFIAGRLLKSGEVVEIREHRGTQSIDFGAYVFMARTERWNFPPLARFRRWLKQSISEYEGRPQDRHSRPRC